MSKSSEEANRELAQQRLNAGQDPGGAYGDLRDKYANQQAEQKNNSGGSNNGCFPASVQIMTPSGATPISMISKGDIVSSWSPTENRMVGATVIRARQLKPSSISVIIFDDGTLLRVTDSHSISTDVGWRAVRKVHSGTQINTANGFKAVVDVTRNTTVEPVYNLITEGGFSFIADDVIAHNFTWMRGLQSIIWSILYNFEKRYSRNALTLSRS